MQFAFKNHTFIAFLTIKKTAEMSNFTVQIFRWVNTFVKHTNILLGINNTFVFIFSNLSAPCILSHYGNAIWRRTLQVANANSCLGKLEHFCLIKIGVLFQFKPGCVT